MAYAYLNGGSFETTGVTSPATVNYTNAQACVMIVVISTYGGSGGFVGISGVTDNAGVTWHRRKRTQYISQFSANGTVNHITQEIWWANQTSTHTSNVTLSAALTNTANMVGNTSMLWVGWTGSPSPSAPWDVNANLPGVGLYSNNSGVATAPSANWSITSTGAAVVSVATVLTAASGTIGGAGTGYSTLVSLNGEASQSNRLGVGVAHELSQTGSGTATWASSQPAWILTADALTGTGTGTAAEAPPTTPADTSTVTTNLTKISQSSAGNVTNPSTGTIRTTLTKLSQTLGGTEKLSGTITTSLHGISITGTLATEQYLGTVTTRLSGLRQSASGIEVFTGAIVTKLTDISSFGIGSVSKSDIATSLQGIRQSASGWASVTGGVTTTLSGISQHATDIEVFTGTIVTNLDPHGITIQGRVFELFTGTIASRLQGISQALVAEEIITGTITTRIGGEGGQAFANVVQAEEIILGPIVMNLQGFKQVLLGLGKLGAPGSGKWYSWRDTGS